MNTEAKNARKGYGRFKRWMPLLSLLIMGLAAHLLLPQMSELTHILETLRGMAYWALGLAFITQIGSYLGFGYLVQKVVALGDRNISIGRGTIVVTAAASIGLVGGGILGYTTSLFRWLKRSGARAQEAFICTWLPELLTLVTLAFIAVIGLIILLVMHKLTTAQVWTFIWILVFLMLVLGLLVMGLLYRERMLALIHRVGSFLFSIVRRSYPSQQVDENLHRTYASLDLLIAGGWRGPLLGNGIIILADLLTLYFIFVAAGHRVPFGVLLAGYGLPLMAGKLPLIPGGVGIIEASMAALYDSLGVPDPITVVVVLIYRFMSFWLPLLLGFPMGFWLERRMMRSQAGQESPKSERL
jgi:uncharacterized protein (TIRG00374 family)